MLGARRTFLVRAVSADEEVVLENLRTRERVQVPRLADVGPRIADWLEEDVETPLSVDDPDGEEALRAG